MELLRNLEGLLLLEWTMTLLPTGREGLRLDHMGDC